MKFEWERLVYNSYSRGGNSTIRAKVFGGWILRQLCWNKDDQVQSESMAFIPDKNHEWEIDKE